jgi:hypothetical protein
MPIAHRATDSLILDVTSALKFNSTPGADESYWHREAGLSQKACAISSETSLHLSCQNVEGAYFNLSCTIVIEEGCQKSKRLTYMAKFKHEVIWCTEDKRNHKAAAIFGFDESNNKYLFTANNEIYKYNTRNNNNLHPAQSNLTKFNKGPSISGIKAFNHLTI